MKSQKHLMRDFTDYENILYSLKSVIACHTDRKEVKLAKMDIEQAADAILVEAEYFPAREHKCKIINETSGLHKKTREIIIPEFSETVIHHMAVNAMMPTLAKGMYEHSYSSIPGRGLHMCRNRVRKWIDNDPKNCKYFIKMDIKKFFPSIDKDILFDRFQKDIKDKEFLNKIVKVILNATPNGLPLGFYTSHWFANYYLTPLDHYIKEELQAVHYVRYMDDMVVFGSNKRKLHVMMKSIKEYVENELGLNLKSNYQLCRFDYIKDGEHHGEFLDFVGFRFYRDRTTLRSSIFDAMMKKCKKINKKGKFTIHDAHQMVSYLGWVNWSDTFQVYQKYIEPVCSFTKCKKKISQYDKQLRDVRESLGINYKEVEIDEYYVQKVALKRLS